MTTTQKQSDYKVEQSSFTLIALFSLEIGHCHGRNSLNNGEALLKTQVKKPVIKKLPFVTDTKWSPGILPLSMHGQQTHWRGTSSREFGEVRKISTPVKGVSQPA